MFFPSAFVQYDCWDDALVEDHVNIGFLVTCILFVFASLSVFVNNSNGFFVFFVSFKFMRGNFVTLFSIWRSF